jgi:nitrite reductase (NO-forming)
MGRVKVAWSFRAPISGWKAICTLAVAALLVAACGEAKAPTWTYPPAGPASSGSPQASATHSGETGSHTPAASGATSVSEISIDAFDLGFTPASVVVDKAGTYPVTFKNTGAALHNVTFADGTKIEAKPGETAKGEVTVPEGGISFICDIPGHAQAGMKGAVSITGATGAGGGNQGGDHGGPPPATDVQADPNAPPYTPFDATAPAALSGTTHDIDMVIEEKNMTVAPGFVQAVWTFGGTVPGPVIRVHVGDTIRVHLKNPATNKLSHSVDFHASQVAWNDEMTSIAPGEEKLYEWRADYAGVWMYHCGTAPALHHIANGMYGMVIVEPKEGWPKVDREFALIQSEWYLGPQGQPIDLDKASAGTPGPDFVVFNGIFNQYQEHPLEVPTGGKVRIFLLDVGPNIDSSFHIVGTIFNTVIKEGIWLTPDNPGHYGSQAVDLSPAQGAIIEFTTAEDGLYPIVTHAFNFVGRGALGLIQAGDGDPRN